LIAWRLRQRRPELSLRVIERGETLGGLHTWSFHETDLDAAQNEWLSPLVEGAWPGHEVRFAGRERSLRAGYRSITSARFHRELSRLLAADVLYGRAAREISADGATLDDGTRVTARCVIDGRGFVPGPWLSAGVQRFVGLDVTLARPHGLRLPLLMDADVAQTGGFRFFYVLPWSPSRLMIEETFYADDGGPDPLRARLAIESYAHARGWRITSIDREERGALPIPLGGDIDALWRGMPPWVGCSGMRGGFFHATTGYSLAEAVRVADALAARPVLDGPGVAWDLRERSRDLWRRQRFLRLLNRMLFQAARPEGRHLVLARFYRLPEDLIERFYAGRSTLRDCLRLLVGRPPVPIHRAIRCIREPRVDPRRHGLTAPRLQERPEEPGRAEAPL